MIVSPPFDKFKVLLDASISAQKLIKLSLGNYKGDEIDLKNIYIKLIEIKGIKMLSFNYRYKTRDIFKNYGIEAGTNYIASYLNSDFNIATLFAVAEEAVLERNLKGKVTLRIKEKSTEDEVSFSHDKSKKRLILAKDNVYLHELGLTDKDGIVFQKSQDKYKQINQYIEILSSLIKEFPEGTIRHVADMGSGKGYLTFALYDYLLNYQQKAEVVGIEFRRDLVDLCNNIAKKADFDQLSFIEGTIDSYENHEINLLIALHACDTATDDAIYKGIKANAELIVVAPCCHKQIRREMEKGKAKNELNFITQHGIFLERQAEMVTDGMRALILEYFGYKTKVFEFVSGVHTPKNVLVVGVKSKKPPTPQKQAELLKEIKATKAYFGIDTHYLEKRFSL